MVEAAKEIVPEERKVALLNPVATRVREAIAYADNTTVPEVTNEQQHEVAVKEGRIASKKFNALTEEKRDIKRKIDAYFAVALDGLNRIDKAFKSAIGKYAQMKRLEEQRLQRELAAKAEAERKKKEKLAREREEKAREYREKGKEGMAARMEASAEEATDEALSIIAPVVQVVKSKGAAMVQTWKAEVLDENAFFKYLTEKDRVREFYVLSQAEVNREAKRIKDSKQIPGLRIWSEERTRYTRSR